MFESGAQPSNSAVEIRNVEPEAYSAEDDVEIGHQRLASSIFELVSGENYTGTVWLAGK